MASRFSTGKLLARHASSKLHTPPSSLHTLSGVWPIVATPFRDDETLDVPAFQRAIRFFHKAGCDGVTINGVLGESNRMIDTEREILIRSALDVANDASDLRICVGTSHAGTSGTVALSRMAQELGAHAVMVTPSKEAAPSSDDALVEFYRRVEEGCPDLPIVLQDHPASTLVHMSINLVARITREVPSVACIKLESLPSPSKIRALRSLWASRPPSQPCSILTGLGALYGAFDLEQGTDGFMTGFAFPEILLEMHRAAQRGQAELAHAVYAKYLPLIVFEQQPGVAVRKELYKRRGLLECAHVRHPAAASASPVLSAALDAQLTRSFAPDVSLLEPLTVSEIYRGLAVQST